jgi:hypothetical protein
MPVDVADDVVISAVISIVVLTAIPLRTTTGQSVAASCARALPGSSIVASGIIASRPGRSYRKTSHFRAGTRLRCKAV